MAAPAESMVVKLTKQWWVVGIVVLALIAAVVICFATGVFSLKSLAAEITAFTVDVEGEVKSAQILPTEGKVNLTMPYGADLTKLYPSISISSKATVTPPSGAEVDFSKGSVTFTVKAENGKEKKWPVNVMVAPNTEAEIKSFGFPGLEKWSPQPDGNTITINAVAKYGTDIKNLVPVIGISDRATVKPASETKQDFSKPVVYMVTAEDRKNSKEYTVKVNVAEPAKKVKLTTIVLGGKSADIDTTKHTVRVEVNDDISLDSVALSKLEGSFGKVKPEMKPGDVLDFSEGAKTFVFSAQDTTVKSSEKWRFIAYYPAEEDSSKSVIKKGEGVEHALIRQILANPYVWGYTGSSLKNRAAVRKWAGSEAHRLAIRTGYVDYATGKEIRVKTGAVYLLWEDGGEVSVSEYASIKDYQKPNTKPTETNVAAASLREAKFATVVQSYEYVFDPLKVKKIVVVALQPQPQPQPVPAPAPGQVSTPQAGAPGSSGAESVPIPFNALPPFPAFNIQE